MAKRKRDMQLNFRVSAEELAVIEQKMSQFGTSNREAYLRKMALDGYVVKLELPELKELVSLMRRNSNNLNQLTRKVHETGRVLSLIHILFFSHQINKAIQHSRVAVQDITTTDGFGVLVGKDVYKRQAVRMPSNPRNFRRSSRPSSTNISTIRPPQ